MRETFEFLMKSSLDLSKWLTSIYNIDQLQNPSYLPAKTILQNVVRFLETIDQSMVNYKTRATECLKDFQADNEFLINKIHKSINNRVIDYIFILIVIYQQIFDEFISNFNLNTKVKDNKKYTKREQTLKMMNELTTKRRGTFMDTMSTDGTSIIKHPSDRFTTEIEAPN